MIGVPPIKCRWCAHRQSVRATDSRASDVAYSPRSRRCRSDVTTSHCSSSRQAPDLHGLNAVAASHC